MADTDFTEKFRAVEEEYGPNSLPPVGEAEAVEVVELVQPESQSEREPAASAEAIAKILEKWKQRMGMLGEMKEAAKEKFNGGQGDGRMLEVLVPIQELTPEFNQKIAELELEAESQLGM
jgi:hypothetical protein